LNTDHIKIGRSGWLTTYAPLFIWIAVIFYLSSGSGSSDETSRFIRPLLEFLFPAASVETLGFYHAVIRKFAHFAVYFVLGIAASNAFSKSDNFRRRWWLFALIVVAAVASLDEFNQSFEPERTSAATDVLLDIFGGSVAVGIFYVRLRSTRSDIFVEEKHKTDIAP
jgi:VanZ family protein